MKKRKAPPLPRRGVALAAAVATLWVVSRTADLKAARSALFSSSRLVNGLLELELGPAQKAEPCLSGWPELVIDQSPLLAEQKAAVNGMLQGEEPPASVSSTEPQDTDPGHDPADGPATESESSAAPAETDPADRSTAEDTSAPEEKDAGSDTSVEEPAAAAFSLDLSGISDSQLDVDNHTDHQDSAIAEYWQKSPDLTLQSAEAGPQILIMHTHATEAYTMADGDTYTESDESRTTDENYNMIRVGEEMKSVFESLGLSVVHDKTTYDYPGYNGSYGRSLVGVQSYLEEYPTIQVVLDVHRDALIGSDGTVYDKTTTIGGEEVAQVMLVVGTNDGGLEHPSWRNNYTLALKIQAAMLTLDSTLPRPIDLRSQRFNQHLTPGSLLVEVGTSGNTLRQALAGARLFAQAAGAEYLACVEDGG